MQFAFTEEQALIRDTAHEFCAEHGDPGRVRAAMDSELGYDEATWRAIGQEMGWTGLAVPEECGGSGLGLVELALLQFEMGRKLLSSPFFAGSCLATPVIRLTATAAQRQALLPAIAGGTTRATLAMANRRGQPGLEGIGGTLSTAGAGYRLSGEAGFVVNAHASDVIVIAARAPGSTGAAGVSVIALAAGTRGIEVERVISMDLTRPVARVHFRDVDVPREAILGEPEDAGAALERAVQLAQIALASEQAGAAEETLVITTDYVKQRVQFGRPIGSFQAIKHRLADMMVLVEAAKSAVYYAAATADEATPELAEAAALAKAYCGDAFFNCAANMIQLHGGVGFTWEHAAHLYFKRARCSSTLLGSPTYQRERIARLMGLDERAAPRATTGSRT